MISIKKLIEKIIESQKSEDRLISDNFEELHRSNVTLFSVLIKCGFFIFFILFVLSFFIESYSSLRIGYFLIMVLIALTYFLIGKVESTKTVLIFYFFYALTVLYASYSSAFITPDYIGIIILVFLFETPVSVLDRTVRITLYELFCVAVYLAVVIPNKEPGLVADEIINVISFFVLGSISGFFFRQARIKGMDLSRRLEIERTTDVLTGLSNRRMLFEIFGKLEENPEYERVYALAIIDIDNFKQYNDYLGHVAGDKCLGRLGKCFREFGEKNCTKFYRYGGEEFIALVFQKTENGPVPLFEELNRDVVALGIAHPTLPDGILTVSIGVVEIEESASSVSFEQKIECADKALYKIKNSVKGNTALY